MATVTKPIALDESFNTTEVTPRNIADVLAEELGRLGSKTASDVTYDNTDSGLVAENVQDALDEINGKVVQSDWEQADPTKDDYIKNKPTTDLQTAVDSFSTLTGGLLSEAKLTLEPVQDLHGYPHPWSGGSGKNKLPLVLADIKTWNTNGTWSGNVYTYKSATFTVNTDDAGNVINIALGGINTGVVFLYLYKSTIKAGSYIGNGTPAGSGWNAYLNFRDVSSSTDHNDTGNGVSFSSGSDFSAEVFIYAPNANTDLNGKVFYPMLRLSTESDPTFESYSNICPISGHTEAELDVSDDDSTTVSYVTPLGTTIYMANIDMVSGECDVIGVGTKLTNVSQLYNFVADSSYGSFANYNMSGLPTIKEDMDIEMSSVSSVVSFADRIATPHEDRIIINGPNLLVRASVDRNITTINELFAVFENGEFILPLATPQHIQLSPQLIQTLVGENNLSVPLEGQTIDEVKYRQVFTFEDVVNYINGQGA